MTGAFFGGCRTAAVELPGDLLTPFGVFCLLDQQQARGRSAPGDAFLFEGALGRFSYVGVGDGAPRITVRDGRASGGVGLGRAPLPAEPLRALRSALGALSAERADDLPPFTGGLAGYLGWGASRFSERLPQRLGPDPLFPECDLLVVRELVAFDHRQGRCWA